MSKISRGCPHPRAAHRFRPVLPTPPWVIPQQRGYRHLRLGGGDDAAGRALQPGRPGAATQHLVAPPPPPPQTPRGRGEVPEPQPLDAEEVAAMLQHGGSFSKHFAEFEHRSQQVEMARAVTEALSVGKHLLVEAGTGTGKSIAYLLPAALWAVKNDSRVVA